MKAWNLFKRKKNRADKVRVLVVADVEHKYLYDWFDKKNFKGVELIISCGDLKASYLSFLVTMLSAPLLYIHGNHDSPYLKSPPEGCENIDGKLVQFKGLNILGLGGVRSQRKIDFHYSERRMKRRIFRQKLNLHRSSGLDILVSHAPAAGLGDGEAYHAGFDCFRDLLDKEEPAYFFHGHQHLCYSANANRIQKYKNTTIVNGYGYYIMDLEFPKK